jgi:hypothetical protein
LPGSFEPDWIFAAFLIRKRRRRLGLEREAAVGIDGDDVGIGMPFSSSVVEALNALQNSMMLTPRWPRAGPIGGDGLAAPAGTWSLI